MRKIRYSDIVGSIADLCCTAACELPGDVLGALKKASRADKSGRAGSILARCVENANMAHDEQVPICQDTGTAVFFVELGSEVVVEGGTLPDAVKEGTALGYEKGYLRKSIVTDPVFDRHNTGDNTPPIIHLDLVAGDRIRIVLAPKGAGAENMSAVAMLRPAEGEEGVARFVADTVIKAGGNPCPPVVVGVGLGGNFEQAPLLAKKALLRPLGQPNPDKRYAALENRILTEVNASDVGPQGLGGSTTALAVHVEWLPCHIASLPLAVNLNCHVSRHAETEL